MDIADDALDLLVEEYTRESGVRSLERQIASICRKLAKEQMGGSYHYQRVDVQRTVELLGPPLYFPERSETLGRPGVCPTLAVSSLGAGLLLVEVLRVEGSGKLVVTGRVGAVLRESASLVLSFWESRAGQYGLVPGVFGKSDFHVHFPGAERPKEGTSAGLAIALAFISLLRETAVPDGMAAIGEVTLRGRVLPVDRMAERLAAAQRAGVTHVIVPERNRPDIEGPPDLVLPSDLKVSYVKTLDEAVRVALPSAQPSVH